MTTEAVMPDAEGDVYAGIREHCGLPSGDTDTDRLARVLSVLDDLDERAEIKPREAPSSLDFKRGVGFAVERLRDVLPPASEWAEASRADQ